MDITYRPFFRDSVKKNSDSDISSYLDRTSEPYNYLDVINGYRRRYIVEDSDDAEEEAAPVESQVEEIRQQDRVPYTSNDPETFASKNEFKDKMIPIYEETLIENGLNPLFAKALVAQDGLESAWGSKPAGRYNFGGIKGGEGVARTTAEVIDGKKVYLNARFRSFDSLKDYAQYKINLLNNKYKAFSGDVSEFADRVAKGGYATSPTYKDTLNSIISSMKKGGILKLDKGGVEESKDWVDNWYKERMAILKRNIQDSQKIAFPFPKVLGYKILSNNINSTNIEVDRSKMPERAEGIYYPDSKSIYLRSEDPSVAVHEIVHSSKPEPQVKKIEKLKEFYGENLYDNKSIKQDDYLDDPNEIYSRLMQLRHALGVSPDHEFTNEEIEELKKKYTDETFLFTQTKDKNGKSKSSITKFDKNGKVIGASPYKEKRKIDLEGSSVMQFYNQDNTFNILNRYSTDSIRRMLNEVAYNNTSKDPTLYAKSGVKLTKENVELKNPDRQSLDKAAIEDNRPGYDLYKDRKTGKYFSLDFEEYIMMPETYDLQKISKEEHKKLLDKISKK